MEGHEKVLDSLEKQQPHSLLEDPPPHDSVIVRFDGPELTHIYLPALPASTAELVCDNLRQNAEPGVTYLVHKSSPTPV